MSACPSELYHKVSDFRCGKACVGVLSLLNPPLFYPPTNTNQPITTNLTTNTSIIASTNLAIIFTRYTLHHSIALKPLNLAYNNTYIHK